MSVAQEAEVANAKYAASFTKGDLALPPQRYALSFHLIDVFRTDQKAELPSQESRHSGLYGRASW